MPDSQSPSLVRNYGRCIGLVVGNRFDTTEGLGDVRLHDLLLILLSDLRRPMCFIINTRSLELYTSRTLPYHLTLCVMDNSWSQNPLLSGPASLSQWRLEIG